MRKKMNKKEFEAYLNKVPVPPMDCKSNGGSIPDHARWGSWLRRNDPTQFEIGLNEYNSFK